MVNFINKLKQMEAKATPGPWVIAPRPPTDWNEGTYTVSAPGNDFLLDDTKFYPSAPEQRDALLIVEMRNCLPELMAVAEQAEWYLTADYQKDPSGAGDLGHDLGKALAALKAKVENP